MLSAARSGVSRSETFAFLAYGGLKMWSMWNAPSDRDYYDPLGLEDVDEPEICEGCGARWDRACEEWCETNRPASEPVPVGCLAVEEQEGNSSRRPTQMMKFPVWVAFRAASQAEAHSRTAGPRRVFCAARMFELCD